MNWVYDTPLEIYADWLEDQGEDVTQLRMLSVMSVSDSIALYRYTRFSNKEPSDASYHKLGSGINYVYTNLSNGEANLRQQLLKGSGYKHRMFPFTLRSNLPSHGLGSGYSEE